MAKTFKVTYTNKLTGELVENEAPHIVFCTDGKSRALVLNDTILASVSNDESDDALWDAGRNTINNL